MAYENDLRPLGPHGQLTDTWYSTHSSYVGLHVPDSVPSHGSSPQSSNGSLIGTPYQTGGSIAEVGGESTFGSSRLHHDGSSITQSTPTIPVNGLGLVLPELRKPLPLSGGYGPGSNCVPDYPQEGQNNDIAHWPHNSNTAYQTGASPSYEFYTQTPARSQSLYHSRSYSDNGSTELFSSSSPSSAHFSSEGSPFGSHRDLPPPINRSNSLPPLVSGDCYTLPPPVQQCNNGQSNYVQAPDYQNTGVLCADERSLMRDPSPQHWLSPPPTQEGRTSPASNASEDAGPSLFQARVGSDRTRAISRSRRTNPDKKLFVCTIHGCGATITSKHNFKSHINSHYGIKPHACGQGRCTKSFGTTAEVKRHRASHCQYRS